MVLVYGWAVTLDEMLLVCWWAVTLDEMFLVYGWVVMLDKMWSEGLRVTMLVPKLLMKMLEIMWVNRLVCQWALTWSEEN